MTYFSMLVVLVVYIVSTQNQALGQDAGDSLPPECTQEYMEANRHTMCMQDDPRVISSGVSDEDKEIIVDLHNQLRANVDPPATDMPALIWDDKIAAVAQKWAKQCALGHDKNRRVPSYGMSIGQNAAAGQRDWHGAVMTWYNEVRFFKYGEDPEIYIGKGGWKKIGHFTQVVQSATFRLGCGFAECNSTKYKRFYICNYGAGQLSYRIPTPYTKGDRASACPDSRHNGLCDCGGKMCLNKGSLDINTCTCSCQKLYSGPNCDTLECPSSDANRCWRSVQPKHCRVTSVLNDCPFMCGLCGGPNGATPPPVFVSKHNCSFQGQRPSVETCQQYGDNGADTTSCDSRGGRFTCADCTKYSNVKHEYCPVMCGVCDGPCNGKNCRNKGKLNRDTCTCECPTPYAGETCETVSCPKDLLDSSHCWKSYKPADCKFTNVPPMCPWMCGTCGEAGATPPPTFVSDFGCNYTGQRKSKEECKAFGKEGADKWTCASQGGKFFDCASCDKYANVKKDYCPVMCGMCDPTPPPEFVSDFGCKYTDQRKSKEECKAFGKEGADKWTCASTGGKYFDCASCDKYANVKKDYCPVMCGMCDPQ